MGWVIVLNLALTRRINQYDIICHNIDYAKLKNACLKGVTKSHKRLLSERFYISMGSFIHLAFLKFSLQYLKVSVLTLFANQAV